MIMIAKKMVAEFRNAPYIDHSTHIKLFFVERCQQCGDLIDSFHIINGVDIHWCAEPIMRQCSVLVKKDSVNSKIIK